MIRRLATAYAASWAFLLWSALCFLAGGFFAIGVIQGYLHVHGWLP